MQPDQQHIRHPELCRHLPRPQPLNPEPHIAHSFEEGVHLGRVVVQGQGQQAQGGGGAHALQRPRKKLRVWRLGGVGVIDEIRAHHEVVGGRSLGGQCGDVRGALRAPPQGLWSRDQEEEVVVGGGTHVERQGTEHGWKRLRNRSKEGYVWGR